LASSITKRVQDLGMIVPIAYHVVLQAESDSLLRLRQKHGRSHAPSIWILISNGMPAGAGLLQDRGASQECQRGALPRGGCQPCRTILPAYSAIHFLPAGGAETRAFRIGVVQGIGEEHDAPRVAAVPQPAGMAQLVDGFLDGPLQKEGVIGRSAAELRPQARQ
jgi:hypothetical protein